MNYSEREQQLEREGRFDVDLMPHRTDNALAIDEDYDYFLRKKSERFFHAAILGVVHIIVRPLLFFACGFRLRGKEKLKGVKSAIVISNQAQHLDCLMVQPRHSYFRLYHTGAGFNAKKDIRGAFLKWLGYLPLNGSFGAQKNLMRRIEDILEKGGYVHFYPEHALWPRYKKPRPFKSGAFRYAAKFSVPVVPAFLTFESTKMRTLLGMKERCVLNVLDPVYPKEGLTDKGNADYLMRACFAACVDCYQKVYGVPLSYEE